MELGLRDMLVAVAMVTVGGGGMGEGRVVVEARTAALMREGAPKSGSEGSGKGPQEAPSGAQHRSLRQQILGPTILRGPAGLGPHSAFFWGDKCVLYFCINNLSFNVLHSIFHFFFFHNFPLR